MLEERKTRWTFTCSIHQCRVRYQYLQLNSCRQASHLQSLVLMGDFNHPHICLRDNREMRRLQGVNSSMCRNTWMEGIQKMKPGSFQWYPVAGQEAVSTNIGGSIWTSGNAFSNVRLTEQWPRLPGESWDLQKPPGQPAPGGPAWAGVFDQTTSRGLFQLQLFCVSVGKTKLK